MPTRSIKLFARARDLAGADVVVVSLPEEPTVADLRIALADQFPNLQPLASVLHVAIGTKYGDDRDIIPADQDVAVFPPVSGG